MKLFFSSLLDINQLFTIILKVLSILGIIIKKRMLIFAPSNKKLNILIFNFMLNILIDLENAEDRKRFVSSVCCLENVTEYSVKSSGCVSVNFDCKEFLMSLVVLRTIADLLSESGIVTRPFAVSFSELLD